MNNALTTYGDISPRTAAHAAAEMLAHAEPVLVLSKFGMAKPLPSRSTKIMKFRRSNPFGAVTAPMVEGVTPTGHKYTVTDVTVEMLQWGDYTEITDVIEDTHEDPVLKEMNQLNGEQAAETIENVIWGVLKGGTSVIYSNGSQRTDVNTTLTLNKIRAAVRYLKAQRGKMITSILGGSPNFATRPIEAGYIAVGHTDLEADIRGLAGFTPTAEYGSRQALCPEEIGSVESLRFVLSPMLTSIPNGGAAIGGNAVVSTGGTNADIYPLIVLAKDAYGLVPLKGKAAMMPQVLRANTPRGGDPLGQRGTSGWKAYFNAVRLNETWMVRIETAASSLA